MKEEATGQVVWVLTYDHKHGTDTYVYDSEDSARLGIVDLMRANFEAPQDDDEAGLVSDIKDMLDEPDPDPYEIAPVWSDAFSDEFFNVEGKDVLRMVPT